MSDGKADDPFKGDKRTDETVMLSSDSLSDIVAQAKGGAGEPAAAAPAADDAGVAGVVESRSIGGPNMAVILGVLAVVVLLAVVAFIAL